MVRTAGCTWTSGESEQLLSRNKRTGKASNNGCTLQELVLVGTPWLVNGPGLSIFRVAGPRMAADISGLTAYSHVQAKQIIFTPPEEGTLQFVHNRS